MKSQNCRPEYWTPCQSVNEKKNKEKKWCHRRGPGISDREENAQQMICDSHWQEFMVTSNIVGTTLNIITVRI
jgi:hypothetical protein